ncbi:MAG TPA: VOC family protein [Candidatus Baltobacteraceae bacterium]|nr:VOC family protein [Candidatus Baltobacteraceae bacterium]
MADALRVFRVMLEVEGLDEAAASYGALFGTPGRAVGGGRHYFDLDGVIVGVVDVARGGGSPSAAGQDLYLACDDLEAAHARAGRVGWLSRGEVHGAPAGAIVVRPWGERSFYVEDPWRNGLCFVDAASLFTGPR